jgi:hypothetical protein
MTYRILTDHEAFDVDFKFEPSLDQVFVHDGQTYRIEQVLPPIGDNCELDRFYAVIYKEGKK